MTDADPVARRRSVLVLPACCDELTKDLGKNLEVNKEAQGACDWETGEVKPDFAVSETSQQVARLILELCRP